MAYLFKSPKPNPKKIRYLKRKRSKDGQEVLNRLQSFLSKNQKDPVEILCGFWEDQQNAISYQELRMAVLEGYLDDKIFRQWSKDYSHLVTTQFDPIWSGAIQAGSGSQPVIDKVHDYFSFRMNTPGVVEWIHNRGSELVTNSSDIQREAINYLLDAKIREWYDPDQLARMIRPCIGLTVGQTSSAKKLYDRTLEDLRKEHPRTKDSVLQKRALDKTVKYAERAHRQRAMTIAQTELAKAYNFGADESIRQAQKNYLIGKCIKRWNTSGDDNVCGQCHDLDGTEVGMEETFYDGSKIVEDGMYPPLHPRCACAIQYIEVEPPDFSKYIDGELETGARTIEEYLERDDVAEEYYDTIRNRSDDVEKISSNISRTQEDVTSVKNHVFYNEHDLGDSTGRFDADYDMSVAWQRMINGEQEDRDILLFEHELLESEVEAAYNLTYRQAHYKAAEKYNWEGLMRELFGEDGEDVDLYELIARER